MLDPNIILRGQQVENPFESAAQGIQFGQGLRQLLSGRQAGKMQQIASPEERQAFANKSMFSRELNAQIKADALAQEQKSLALQKHNADISKTNSEAFKNNQQGSEFKLENSQKQLGAIQGAIQQAAMTGDKTAAIIGLDAANRVGLISPEDYSHQYKLLTAMTPEEVKSYAQSVTFANAKDPASLVYTSADNVLDNETARRGQDIDQTVADNRLAFDYEKTNAENQYKYDALAQNDDQFWADFNQKDAQFYSDQDFQLMKSKLEKQQVKNETPEQRMTRIDNTVGSADAARSAARAAQDAAALINHPGITSGTGTTSLMGVVPGTDAKDFRVRLENLKSQVFLPTVKALQGMGALSNAEGEKISAAVANLDPGLGEDAMKQQLTILAQQMSRAAQVSKQKTLNYATRGGTIQLQTKQGGQNQGGSKVYTQAMIREYAQQTGRSMQEVAQTVRDSGGIIQ
ncbi:hypothetical protein ACDI99_10110 [Acinetobacter radioresistens]|uniref:hypothetical protein n=1 Tax=Acinetobacter radioresistens TaxID=40216 RepID=UPI003556616A